MHRFRRAVVLLCLLILATAWISSCKKSLQPPPQLITPQEQQLRRDKRGY